MFYVFVFAVLTILGLYSLWHYFSNKSSKTETIEEPKETAQHANIKKWAELVQPKVKEKTPIEKAEDAIIEYKNTLKTLSLEFNTTIDEHTNTLSLLRTELESIKNEKLVITEEIPILEKSKSINGLNKRKERLSIITIRLKELETDIVTHEETLKELYLNKESSESMINEKILTLTSKIKELKLEMQMNKAKQLMAKANNNEDSIENELDSEIEKTRVAKRLASHNITTA